MLLNNLKLAAISIFVAFIVLCLGGIYFSQTQFSKDLFLYTADRILRDGFFGLIAYSIATFIIFVLVERNRIKSNYKYKVKDLLLYVIFISVGFLIAAFIHK